MAMVGAGRGGARGGRGHHLLPHLPDLQLEADLARKHEAVFRLELSSGLVGGEETFLLEQFHDKLSTTVKSLPQ